MNPYNRNPIWSAHVTAICGLLYMLLCGALMLKNWWDRG